MVRGSQFAAAFNPPLFKHFLVVLMRYLGESELNPNHYFKCLYVCQARQEQSKIARLSHLLPSLPVLDLALCQRTCGLG
jgi:hypothetical protein